MLKRTLFFLVFTCFSLISFSQNGFVDHNWFFGQGPFCLKFGKGDNLVRLDSLKNPNFGSAGAAVATDPFSGNFLFYTDGVNVYNARHEAMGNITGNSSLNQPVAIAPVPDTTDFYYIVYNDGNGLSFQTVNMAANEIPGASIALGEFAGSGSVYGAPVAEGMRIIRGGNPANPVDWLIFQDQFTREIFVYRVLPGGNFAPADTLTLGQQFTTQHISYSEARNQLALAPNEPNFNVHLLNFDDGLGQLTVPAQDSTILNSAGTGTPAVYDAEWSASGNLLYISRNNGPGQGQVLQYNIGNDSSSVFVTPILPVDVHQTYGLRLGVDDRIYHLYQEANGGDFLMGVINNPDFVIDSVGYAPVAFDRRDFGGTQFPEVAPPDMTMQFSGEIIVYDTCIANTTKFAANVSPEPVTYQWSFGDGGTATGANPVYQYMGAGQFTVQLIVSGFGIVDTLARVLSIGEPPSGFMFNLGNDTTICDPLFIPTGSGGISPDTEIIELVWSTGEVQTTPPYGITVPDTSQLYWAAATVNGGCVLYDEIEITEFGEQEQIFNYWHFGNQAGINFLVTGPVALNFNLPLDSSLAVSPNWNAPEGSASISDRNGDLLFYTNGQQVYNQVNELMAGPDGVTPAQLVGSTLAAQSSIFVQLPDDQPYYYVFTTREVFDGAGRYDLSYSIIDLKQDSARGIVIQQNVPVYSRATERLTVFGGGGQDAWVISHEYGNNTFRAYPLTAEGLGEPVLSSAGSIHSFGSELEGQGYMKLNGAGDRLAVALATEQGNFIELFRFNSNTGRITEAVSRIPAGGAGPIYGLEFSPGGNKLFASFLEPSSVLREFAIDSLDRDVIVDLSAQLDLNEPVASYGAIQRGPDGQIYVAQQGDANLGTISAIEDSLTSSTFNSQGFSIAPGVNTLGLPNFSQQISSPIGAASVSAENTCALPDSIDFTGNGSYDTDEFEYQIFDVGSGNPVFVESRPRSSDGNYRTGLPAGEYEVRFLVYNICSDREPLPYDGDTLLLQVDNAPSNFIAPALAICNAPVTITPLIADDPGLSFSWSNGDTTYTTEATAPGSLSLTVTTAGGCAQTESIQIIDGNPPVDIGPPSQGFCLGETIADLNAGNPGATFQWFINGIEQTGINTQTFVVDAGTPGSFQYIVNVTDPITLCIGSDTTTINILEVPTVMSMADSTSACGQMDGSIDITVTPAGGNYSFSWSNGAQTEDLDSLLAGSYTVVVTDNVSGCFTTETVGVEDGASTFEILPITDATACRGDSTAQVAITLSQDDFNFAYELIDLSNGQTIAQMSNLDSTFVVSGLYIGNFQIEVLGIGSNCRDIEAFEVTAEESLDLRYPSVFNWCQTGEPVTPELLLNPVDDQGNIVTLSDVVITWTSDIPVLTNDPFVGQILGFDFSSLLSPTNPVDTATLTAVAEGVGSNAGLCDTTFTVRVVGSLAPDVVIDQAGDVCDGAVTLSANDNNFIQGNNYSYQWIESTDTAQLVVGTTQNIGVNSPFVGQYIGVVRNSSSGCSSSDTVALSVESLVISLSSSVQCDNELPVVLTTELIAGTARTYQYVLEGDTVTQNPVSPILEINDPGANGLYTVNVTSFSGQCDTTASINVNINTSTPNPISDTTFCSLSERILEIDGGIGFTLYEWALNETVLSNQQILNLPSTMLPEGAQSGLYTGSFTNDAGCITVETFFVSDDCAPRVIVPNAFAPEGNSPNNVFSIVPGAFGSDVDFVAPENFEVFIYNRWGELVFFSTDKDFQWDGMTKGGEQAGIGTYTYFMRFSSSFEKDVGEIFEQRGAVVLLR
jgi:hypothetical protein